MKLVRFGWFPFPCVVLFGFVYLNGYEKLVGALLIWVWFALTCLAPDSFIWVWISLSLSLTVFSLIFLCFGCLRKFVATLCTTTNYFFPLFQPQILLSSFSTLFHLSLFLLSYLQLSILILSTPSSRFSFSFCLPVSAVILWLYCRIISSTWVSWGCSGQLVSSSYWGREKPFASCSGPSFSPSRFTPNYTAQDTHTNHMHSHLYILQKYTYPVLCIYCIHRWCLGAVSYAMHSALICIKLNTKRLMCPPLRHCLMSASSLPCCSSFTPSLGCRWVRASA